MPRRVDYVSRFEFIRQAAFAVVRDDGVDALSRRRVALELGASVNTIRRLVADWADLACLAADQVVSRRRRGRIGRSTDDPLHGVAIAIRGLMPEDATHLDEELVWLKLMVGYGLHPSGLERPGEVGREFGIAQRGYDDGLAFPGMTDQEPTGHTQSEQSEQSEQSGKSTQSRRTALERYVTQRDEELAWTVGCVLDLLGVPEPRKGVAALLVAVVEGLTLSACLGRVTPEEATELAVGYALSLQCRPAPAGDPMPASVDTESS